MNKEQQELLNEAYKNYKTKTEIMMGHGFHGTLLSQEEFINKIKTDDEFSQRWRLKIEERELSFNERIKHIVNSLESNAPLLMENDDKTIQWLDKNNVPTKLITITYNDKTIESYE
jgi:hypothetical protein